MWEVLYFTACVTRLGECASKYNFKIASLNDKKA